MTMPRILSWTKPRRLGRRGISSAEFALVSVPLLVLMLSGIELVRYAATITSLRTVTDEAVRTATLRGYSNLINDLAPCNALVASGTLITATAPVYVLNREHLTVLVDSCTTNGAVTTVNLTARYAHSFLFARLTRYSGTLVETATASFN